MLQVYLVIGYSRPLLAEQDIGIKLIRRNPSSSEPDRVPGHSYRGNLKKLNNEPTFLHVKNISYFSAKKLFRTYFRNYSSKYFLDLTKKQLLSKRFILSNKIRTKVNQLIHNVKK